MKWEGQQKMKKPKKFNTYLNAMYKEACRLSLYDLMEEWGINKQEVNECQEFESYIRQLDEIPEQKTCYIKNIADEEQYYGAVCSACNFELSRYMDDYGSIGFDYCPICGAKVVV